jgi:TrmH family RNA methyltransferase
VLVLGHEGSGLSKEVQEAADAVVHIEMDPAVKSLNVAAAAAIMLHHLQKS